MRIISTEWCVSRKGEWGALMTDSLPSVELPAIGVGIFISEIVLHKNGYFALKVTIFVVQEQRRWL